jgi:DNA-binding IclR family transcriptional regulator
MHIVPSGLVVLSYWPDGAVNRLLGRRLDRYTVNTETRPKQIRERLAAIRRNGHVWCHEEYSEGINSVAAPIFDDGVGVVGALHCHGPSYRFPDESMRDIAAGLVTAGAAAVSSDLGRRS